MVYSKFWGRQQKRLVALSLAASGSFVLGIMMPGQNRMSQLPISTVSSVSSIDVATATQSPETQSSQLPDQPSPKIQQMFSLRDHLGGIKSVMALQVEDAKKTVEQLEENRFTIPIPQRFQGKIIAQDQLKIDEKIVALTFDDGPWPETTEQILEILQKNQIKATFFVVGQHLKAFPEIGKKIVLDGHVIANHSWAHPTRNMSRERAQNEIENTAKLVEELTGIQTNLFRPPGGVLTNGLTQYAQEKNYATIMWSADSMDWRASESAIIQNVLRQVKPGAIVLFHDGGGNRAKTVKALPKIISKLQEENYQFVTVPELLQHLDQKLASANQ